MEKIKVTLNTQPKELPDFNDLPFGTYFSDHMFVMNYVDGQGWINPRIVPYGPF